jgi:nucleoside-diphosphate-sugar epimerase
LPLHHGSTQPSPDRLKPADLKYTAESWRGKDVRVTGPGGFVGFCLVNRLVELGAKVTVVLRDHTRGNNFALLGLRDRVNIVNRSVTDLGLVERTLDEYEVVILLSPRRAGDRWGDNRLPMSTWE